MEKNFFFKNNIKFNILEDLKSKNKVGDTLMQIKKRTSSRLKLSQLMKIILIIIK